MNIIDKIFYKFFQKHYLIKSTKSVPVLHQIQPKSFLECEVLSEKYLIGQIKNNLPSKKSEKLHSALKKLH